MPPARGGMIDIPLRNVTRTASFSIILVCINLGRMEAYLAWQSSLAPSSSGRLTGRLPPFKASQGWPPAKDLSSLKYTIREGNFTVTCVPRSAQEGSITSRVWRHEIDLRRTNTKRPDWLCYLCWDRRRVAYCLYFVLQHPKQLIHSSGFHSCNVASQLHNRQR
jgi:hypothetical protein